MSPSDTPPPAPEPEEEEETTPFVPSGGATFGDIQGVYGGGQGLVAGDTGTSGGGGLFAGGGMINRLDPLSGDHGPLHGLSIGGDVTAMYDSNIYQTSGLRGVPKTDDYVFGFEPYIAYGSTVYGVLYTIKGQVDAKDYIDNSRLSGAGYSIDFDANYQGAKINFDSSISGGLIASVDRDYGDYVERNYLRLNQRVEYKFSQKTSVDARASYSSLSPDDPRFFDTSIYGANVALSWQTSPLLNLEGGIGWIRSDGVRQDIRDSVGPLARLNYNLSTKLSLQAETQLNYVSYSRDGSDDMFLTMLITGTYVPDPFWAFRLIVVKDAEPDGSIAGSYRQLFTVTASVEKKIGISTAIVGFSYSNNANIRVGGTSTAGDLHRELYTLSLLYRYPLFKDKVNLEAFTNLNDEESNRVDRAWSGAQYGLAVRSSF